MSVTGANEARVLVLAPTGQDAPSVVRLLAASGLVASALGSMQQLVEELAHGAGAAVVALEALDAAAIAALLAQLRTQALWSKLPIVLVTWHQGSRDGRIMELVQSLGERASVILLERPFSAELLLGTVRFALQARRGQYELRDLTHRLDQQADELRRSNQQLEHFAAVASHDLRAPLSRMALSLELAMEHSEQLSAEVRRRLDSAREGAARMRQMIDGLLAQSGPADQVATPRVACDADAALSEALENLAQAIAASGTRIHRDKLPALAIDRLSLMRIFQNLIDNAIRYRHPDRVPEIAIAPAGCDRERCRIAVADNGQGMDPAQRRQIFTLFDRSGRTDQTGSGIGLALVQRILERHHGTIEVESQPGVGSTFTVTLPRAA